MAAAAGENWWRKALAIGVLSFGAVGLVGCDDTGTGGEEEVEQEAPAGDETTDATEDEFTPDDQSPTEGEIPAEQGQEQDDEG